MKTFKFKINGNEYDVEIKEFEDHAAQIEVNGSIYNIELDAQVKTPAPKTPKLVRKPANLQDGQGMVSKTGGGNANVKSPLPGVIMEVSVKVGDSVKRGQKVLTMEAMKMHNDVLAEKDGTVKAIKCAAGDSVMEGDVLVEVE